MKDAYTYGYLMSELSGNVTDDCSFILKYSKIDNMINLNFTEMHKIKNKAISLNFTNYKSIVPINYSYKSKLQFMKGYIDSRGIIGNDAVRLMSDNIKLLKNIKYLLQTCGIDCFLNKSMGYYLIIYDVKFLKELNIKIENRYNSKFRNIKHYYIVESIEYTNRIDKTYCFNESIKHLGIFNGLLTGQCTEIMEVSDSKETAVCNLASICLPKYIDCSDDIIIYSKSNCKYCTLSKNLLFNIGYKFTEILLDDDEERMEFYEDSSDFENDIIVNTMPQILINNIRIGGYNNLLNYIKSDACNKFFNFEKLGKITETIVDNLNIVIDINHYPTPESKLSNLKNRPIGIGVQGLADVFMILKLPFTSDIAKKLNKDIFETIYYYSLKKSNELSIEHGAYETFQGSPTSNGILQFDLWNKTPELYSIEQWDELKQQIVQSGLRNSLLVAPMPTASTAQIMGNNESIEPYTSNIYTRRVLAGEFILINKHLVKTLKKYALWTNDIVNSIIYNKGSVQQLDIPNEIKDVYKTAWEISQKSILDMSADRGAYICQSQSLNIFIDDADPKKINSVHMYGHSLGLKTGSYYIRTKPVLSSQNFSMDYSVEQKLKNEKNEEPCLNCSS